MAWLSILLKNARKERGSRYSAAIASLCPVTNDPPSNANWEETFEVKSYGENREIFVDSLQSKRIVLKINF